jgi:hypothetical protein
VHERFEIAALSGQLSNLNVTHEQDAKFAQYYNEVTQAKKQPTGLMSPSGKKAGRKFADFTRSTKIVSEKFTAPLQSKKLLCSFRFKIN